MKNKPRKLARSSDKDAHMPFSKSKDKSKQKKSESSMAYESCRNSLGTASPRPSKIVQKYRTYIQFIATNKLATDHPVLTDDRALPKKKANTPTPRKNSPVPYFKGRKSALSKFYQPPSPSNLAFTQRNSFPKQKPQDSKKSPNLTFFVHGKNPNTSKDSHEWRQRKSKRGEQNGCHRGNSKKKNMKNNPIAKKGLQQRSTNKSSLDSNYMSSKLDKQEQKLCLKLFKGIQFYRDLGRGAHALVRSAVDWNHKRKIAVKIYQKSQLSEEQLNSIQRQIQILNDLDHTNIIALYEIIETFKTINLVMEYGGGNSLEQYIKSKPEGHLDQKEAKLIFRQILEAVAYLHKKNVTHRDIKTQNILLNKHLHLKIIDFGFSLPCPNGFKTIINSYCGTPTYMAPQVVSKTPHNPQLADRWSLGILLFNMLNGHCPFRASTQKQLFAKINKGQFEYYTDVDPDAKDLINKFLCKNPLERIPPQEAIGHRWLQQ